MSHDIEGSEEQEGIRCAFKTWWLLLTLSSNSMCRESCGLHCHTIREMNK